MSEYMEKKFGLAAGGAPPDTGYEEGNSPRLSPPPYSVVLLDEVEKAHPDVQHSFAGSDDGRIT